MFVDDTFIADTWAHLRPDMVTSAEAVFTLLGQPQPMLRNIPLSTTKHKYKECSYDRKQLGILINTRELTICILDDKRNALEHTLRTT